jgi:hypothetical protein
MGLTMPSAMVEKLEYFPVEKSIAEVLMPPRQGLGPVNRPIAFFTEAQEGINHMALAGNAGVDVPVPHKEGPGIDPYTADVKICR